MIGWSGAVQAGQGVEALTCGKTGRGRTYGRRCYANRQPGAPTWVTPQPPSVPPGQPSGVLLGVTVPSALGSPYSGFSLDLLLVAVAAQHLEVVVVVCSAGRDVLDVVDLECVRCSAFLTGSIVSPANAFGLRSRYSAVATRVTGPGHQRPIG